MDVDFWNDLWRRGDIPFHREEVNPSLVENFERLGLKPGADVCVPLCGMSHDMTWLDHQGFRVHGYELSGRAADYYFRERNVRSRAVLWGDVIVFSGGNVSISVGDFFDLSPRVRPFDAWYDRAALIALPVEMRQRYVDQVRALCAPDAPGLLVSMEHDRGTGPPFSVEAEEIERLYHPMNVEKLGERRGGKGSGGSRSVATTYLVTPHSEDAR